MFLFFLRNRKKTYRIIYNNYGTIEKDIVVGRNPEDAIKKFHRRHGWRHYTVIDIVEIEVRKEYM